MKIYLYLFPFAILNLTSGFFLSKSYVNFINGISQNALDDSSLIALSIVKRSSLNGIELTKTYKGDTKNNFNCVITFTSPLNSIYILIDDIKGLSVSNAYIQTNQTNSSLSFPNPDHINVSISNGMNQTIIRYDFQIKAFSSQIIKVVNIYNSGDFVLSENACVSPGTFSDNLNSNLLVVLFLLLGLFIVFIFFLIVLFCCKHRSDPVDQKSTVNTVFTTDVANMYLLLDNSQTNLSNNSNKTNEKTFINSLIENDIRIIEHEIYNVDFDRSKKTDLQMKNDFEGYSKTVFQIWLNNIIDKYPKLKTNVEDIRNRLFKRETELNEILQKTIDENKKKIMNESINLNKMNLDFLTNNQEEERMKIMKLTALNNKERVEKDLNKVFELQRHDLITQLKVKENLDMEKFELSQEENKTIQLNEIYSSAVKEILLNKSNEPNAEGSQIISPEDSNEILKKYFDWQHQLQLIKEKEKIRQMGNYDFICLNQTNLIEQKVNDIQNLDESIEKKCEYFVNCISNLSDNEEIDHVTATEIVAEFGKYKINLLKETDIEKQKQLSLLTNRLNDKRKSKMDELVMQHNNEINNLLVCHKNDSDNKLMNENIVNLEKQFNENVCSEEIKHNNEGAAEIRKLYAENATQINEKLDSKIKILINELKSEGVSSKDISNILNNFNKRSTVLKTAQDDERERQMNAMKEKLLKAKENIDKTVKKKINEKQQLFEPENNITDELLNIQKILSDDDRNNILKEYNKHKLFAQTSISNSFLEQRKKLEEALTLKKIAKLNELNEKHEKKMEEMVNRKMKHKIQKSEDEIKGECEKELLVEYLNEKLQVFTFSEWKKDLDKELEVIQKDLIAEREALLKKKEEESVALILQVQMSKSKDTVELKEQEKKILKLQLVVLEANKAIVPNSQEIFKSYQKTKDNLQYELERTKLQQEMEFKKKLESRKKGSLFKRNINDETKTTENVELQRKQQDIEDQKLKNEIKFENSKQDVEKGLLKEFISSSDCSREDVFNLMMEIYPLKPNQNIEVLVEEFYPKSKQQSRNVQSRSGITLLEAYRKYNEKNTFNANRTLNDSQKISEKNNSDEISNNYDNKPESPVKNSKDFNKNNFKEPTLNNYKEPFNYNVYEPEITFKKENEIYKENVEEDNLENTKRRRKKKKRRKLLTNEIDDEKIDDETL